MNEPTNDGEKQIIRNELGQIMPGSAPLNPTGKQAGSIDRAKAIKIAFLEAFDRIGGIDGLVRWIDENKLNKREFYKMMLSILPKETDIQEDPDRKVVIIREMPTIMKDGKPLEFNIGKKVD